MLLEWLTLKSPAPRTGPGAATSRSRRRSSSGRGARPLFQVDDLRSGYPRPLLWVSAGPPPRILKQSLKGAPPRGPRGPARRRPRRVRARRSVQKDSCRTNNWGHIHTPTRLPLSKTEITTGQISTDSTTLKGFTQNDTRFRISTVVDPNPDCSLLPSVVGSNRRPDFPIYNT